MKPSPFVRYLILTYFIIPIFLFLNIGCKKSSSAPPANVFPDGVDIYMAGQTNGHVVYWKNGQLVDLGAPGYATGIAASGADVYLSANVNDGSKAIAAYWKNNDRFDLSGSRFANAYGIAVAGADVYIVGLTVGVPVDTVVYWKNGIESILYYDIYTSPIYSMTADGSDVYMTGGMTYHIKDGGPAIPGAGPAAVCNAMTVAGADIYFTGDSIQKPYYWKNGQPVQLAYDEVSLASTAPISITVSGTDVYVAGTMPITPRNGNSRAVYWKNGALTRLDTKYTASSAQCIVVVGKDIYVAGSINDNGRNVPVYWKNGQMVRLATEGYVQAMVVRS